MTYYNKKECSKNKQKKNDDDNYKNVILVKKMFLVKTIGEKY
jgi:hypothetical protein